MITYVETSITYGWAGVLGSIHGVIKGFRFTRHRFRQVLELSPVRLFLMPSEQLSLAACMDWPRKSLFQKASRYALPRWQPAT